MLRDVAGLYFLSRDQYGRIERTYLPQVSTISKTLINTTTYSTSLKQTFVNPTDVIQKQGTYAFPLYEGIVITSFTCRVGDQVILGKVHEKQEARQIYDDAVSRGETAGLLESLPAGIFSISLGNISAQSKVEVDIEYGGELKHDAEIDGIRYTLPTTIAPRYGSYPGEILELGSRRSFQTGMRIEVDVDVRPCDLRSISVPSQTFESLAKKYVLDSASVTGLSGRVGLDLDTAEMSEDLVLLFQVTGIAAPQAVLEISPDGSQTVMASFVPRFQLPNATPEIVFIADQSGSMSGTKNDALVAALEVFLKSLPTNVTFNICAFGSSYKFIFDTAEPYTRGSAKKALDFVRGFGAQYGGTEMLQPVTEVFKKRHGQHPLEVILLTDGEIWGETRLFDFISEQIDDNAVDARVFCLGFGGDVSHTLVEGVARAGNGIAQFVGANESLDKKVMRMLKACLQPHLKDVKMEVQYTAGKSAEDDYHMIDSSETHDSDGSTVGPSTPLEDSLGGKVVSLYNGDVDMDSAIPNSDAEKADELPLVLMPDDFDAPLGHIPLIPFNRTTMFHHEERSSARPISVRLTAKWADGKVDLDIPIKAMDGCSTAIKALAARRAIQDLEGGRGYLAEYIPRGSDKKLKEYFTTDDEYQNLVKKAIVDLGVKHQIASTYTSFVAVEANTNKQQEEKQAPAEGSQAAERAINASLYNQAMLSGGDYNALSEEINMQYSIPSSTMVGGAYDQALHASVQCCRNPSPSVAQDSMVSSLSRLNRTRKSKRSVGGGIRASAGALMSKLVSRPTPPPAPASIFAPVPAQTRVPTSAFASSQPLGAQPFGHTASIAGPTGAVSALAPAPPRGGLFGHNVSVPPPPAPSPSAKRQAPSAVKAPASTPVVIDDVLLDQYRQEMQSTCEGYTAVEEDDDLDWDCARSVYMRVNGITEADVASQSFGGAPTPAPAMAKFASERQEVMHYPFHEWSREGRHRPKPKTDEEVVRELIATQDFEGYWAVDREMLRRIGIEKDENAKGIKDDVGMTKFVLKLLEDKYHLLEDVWEMCHEKGTAWLKAQG